MTNDHSTLIYWTLIIGHSDVVGRSGNGNGNTARQRKTHKSCESGDHIVRAAGRAAAAALRSTRRLVQGAHANHVVGGRHSDCWRGPLSVDALDQASHRR